jgi:solute carrier family 13 (sodium-dependent dicarboxylate transporter), member 2/3/5
MSKSKTFGLSLGLFCFLIIILFIDLDSSNPQVSIMAAIAALMAVWWITEAIPLAVTSLVPLIMYPLFGILTGDEIAGSYINSVIFLFLGGFMIAIAMEEWNLHRRIALRIIRQFGGSPVSIVSGFMISGAFLSMWISNTATAIMMLPIAMAIIKKLEDEFGEQRTHNFSVILLLGIAYSCSIGGVATLVGTPPNLVFARMINIIFPESPEIGFGQWMLLGLPISIMMLTVTAIILTKFYFKVDKEVKIKKEFITEEYNRLGAFTYEQKAVSIIFSLTALLWIFRADLNIGIFLIPGWSRLLPYPDYINDGTVAITMALLLFLIPSKSGESNLLNNSVFRKIPWGIILLFGGGFALAHGFTSTGLSLFIGQQLSGLAYLSPILIVIITATTIIFLTELTSNTASTQMILPILASVSVAIGLNPLLLMLTATVSASMAFMLPVATPPNTIVFASERIRIPEMVRAGFALNILGIIIVSLIIFLIGSQVFDLQIFPDWAN